MATELERARAAYRASLAARLPKTPADEYIVVLEREVQDLKSRLSARRRGW